MLDTLSYRRLAIPVVKGTKPSGKARLSLPYHHRRAFPSLKDRREISEFWRRTLRTKRWAFCALLQLELELGKKYGGHYRGAAKLSSFLFLSPPYPLPLSSRLTVFPSFVDKAEFFFFSIKEEGEIEINRGLIIKSGY